MILYGILVAAIVAGDQLVKWWAVKALGPGGSWDVLPGIFSLTYAENQGAAFVIGGALGNGIDRVLRGYVVDMFEVRFIRFAIFNVADIFITVGGVMLVIYFLFLEGKTLGGKE